MPVDWNDQLIERTGVRLARPGRSARSDQWRAIPIVC
jgi:hypothetical protein